MSANAQAKRASRFDLAFAAHHAARYECLHSEEYRATSYGECCRKLNYAINELACARVADGLQP